MLNKIVHNLMQPRHFWRKVDMSELSELYASMLIRSLALSLIGLFVPIYLYKIGYSVQAIFGYFAVLFIAKTLLDIVSAFVIGRIGPKHAIALSTIGNIINLMMLLSIKELHWPLALLAILSASSLSLFFIAFHTDFSKIKHSEHGGKELGYMAIIERIGGVAGPLLGGVLATFFDARYTIVLAIVLLIGSLVPLLTSNEVVKVHQAVTFNGFTYKKHIRNFVSYACHNTENSVSVVMWTFFIALTVFKLNTYASIGAITALGTGISLLIAKTIGTLVDNKHGNKLLNIGVFANALVMLARPLIRTPLSAIGVNMINDPVTICYRMPFMKNFYDAADNVSGYRIVFIAFSESMSALMRAFIWGGLFISSFNYDPISAIKVVFYITAIISLGIALQPRDNRI